MAYLRTLVCVLLVVGIAAPAVALDTKGRVDQGWTLGIGFGMGRAHVNYLGGDIESDLREGVNTEWRLG